MFPDDLDVRVVTGGRYVLLRPFRYKHRNGGVITVPVGFTTDFASIPAGFRWLITGHGATRKPAVIHDYLYATAKGDRKEADLIFREGMDITGVPFWKRELCYRAVRLGGWIVWRKYRA